MNAHTWTDKELAKLERELQKAYQSNYNELKKEITDLLTKVQSAGGWDSLTPAQRYTLSNKYDRLNKLADQLSTSLKNVNADAVKLINNSMANVYKQNYNENAEAIGSPFLDKNAIAKELMNNTNPYAKISMDGLKDKVALQNEIKKTLVNGIMNGDSIGTMAKSIKATMENSMSQSIRIARTETTRIEGAAKQAVADKGKSLGFEMLKMWVSTEDERTREGHKEMQGVIVGADDFFNVPVYGVKQNKGVKSYYLIGHDKIMHPGDPAGDPADIINCRCTMVSIINDGSYEKQDDGTYIKVSKKKEK